MTTSKKTPSKKTAKKKSKVKTKKQPGTKKPKRKPRKKSLRPNAVGLNGLTPKQNLFVNYYIGEAEFNAAKACRLAGYSEDSAKEIGTENLTKPIIATAIFQAIEKRTKEVETSAKWVLDRLHTQAVADLNDIYDEETGALKPIKDWPMVWRQGLVVGVDTKEEFEYEDGQKKSVGFVVKVKISERIKRDELIGKHHAMFTDNVNLGGDMILRSLTDDELDEKLKKLRKQNAK